MTHLLERTCAATCSTLKRTPELVQLASMENLFLLEQSLLAGSEISFCYN